MELANPDLNPRFDTCVRIFMDFQNVMVLFF